MEEQVLVPEDLVEVKGYVNVWGGKDGIILSISGTQARVSIDTHIINMPLGFLERRKAKKVKA